MLQGALPACTLPGEPTVASDKVDKTNLMDESMKRANEYAQSLPKQPSSQPVDDIRRSSDLKKDELVRAGDLIYLNMDFYDDV